MAVFEYRGITAAGKAVHGVRDASDPKSLKALLRKDGVFLTEVLEEAAAKARRAREVNIGAFFRRISQMDVAVATRQLATLMGAGITLVEALGAVIDQLDNPEFKRVFTAVRTRVTEGSSFAEALSAHPRLFPGIYVNMVAAGEASGTLEIVLGRLADFGESQTKLRQKVISAMAYPIFMMVIGVIIITIMMIVVVPKVTGIFEDFNKALPWYTQMLIFISGVVSSWVFWVIFIPVAVGTVLFFRSWARTKPGREKVDRFLLWAPLFGPIVRNLAISRFAQTLSTLLASGVPLLKALEITRNVLANVVLEAVVEEAAGSIREGESIAEPLKRSGRFPPMVTHMIAIGERSGQLESMLGNVARFYEGQVEARLSILTSLLEPLMILLMGGMAGGIAFSILMPILQLNEFVQ
ncbi:MAG: type II secretion system inner membrane protein GspF [Deltaproteobacteria bacterium]|nr:type II secretion system inner membrane protein GspF [Deltaproteobacteria bacterium]